MTEATTTQDVTQDVTEDVTTEADPRPTIELLTASGSESSGGCCGGSACG